MVFQETEIVIDFPITELPTIKENEQTTRDAINKGQRSNVASNRALNNASVTNPELERELDRARELLNDVSKQLSKEIPTADELKMPVKTSEGMDPDSLMKKQYSGESNVEYFLENRYHLQLPIPVYLSQYGGEVKMNIVVDANGRVISAEPASMSAVHEQLLSYAKTAALRTKFNPLVSNNKRQNGYIIYRFIPQ